MADIAGSIADDLERLCCAETEAAFFDYVTESVGSIVTALRALSSRDAEIERLRAALRQASEWFLRPENLDLNGSDAVYLAIDAALSTEQSPKSDI